MNACNIKLLLLIPVIIVFILSIVYIYNIRIEGMKVRYDCPNLLSKTTEGIFKLSYENDKKPPNYFYSLEEYINRINWQKENSIVVPY